MFQAIKYIINHNSGSIYVRLLNPLKTRKICKYAQVSHTLVNLVLANRELPQPGDDTGMAWHGTLCYTVLKDSKDKPETKLHKQCQLVIHSQATP